MAGLSTPLHLAASLLALFAAAGLAILVVVRPGALPDRDGGGAARAGDLLVVAGAVAYATGHGLSGALLFAASGEVVAWLRTAGLAGIAIGLVPGRLAGIGGAAVVIPAVPLTPALVGAAAGAVAGLRALTGGRQAVPVAVGFLAWGAAEALTQRSAAAAAWATVAGAMAVGVFLWHASTRRLLAKFVTAFVVALLGVVVLMAGVLSGFVSQALVREELRRLDSAARQLATDVTEEWPQAAINAATPLRNSVEVLLGVDLDPDDGDPVDPGALTDEELAGLYELSFVDQDFVVLLDGDGDVLAAHDPDGRLGDAFARQVAGSRMVEALVAREAPEGSDVAGIGGRLVALGGVRLESPAARGGDPSLGFLVTGRVLDPVRAARLAQERDVDILALLGGELSAASPAIDEIAPAIADDLLTRGRDGVTTAGGDVAYVSAAPVLDPGGGPALGSIATVSDGALITALERGQARQLFVLSLAGAVVAGLVAGGVTGRLVAPIRRLTAAAVAVREGALDTQADVGTSDEVGDLGRSFNAMTVSLAAQSAQLRDAAEEQARLRARLEALTASMSDALVAVDTDNCVIAFNPAAERLVGRPAGETRGLPLTDVLVGYGPGDRTPAQSVGAASSEQVVAVQFLLETPDGVLVPTAATAAPVRDESGAVFGRVLVLRDVTREAEVERMKTEFLSNVSHELRTPLTPIKGYAEVLARRDVGRGATRQFASEILASTRRLERIVGMIVDFAALDSGRIELAAEPTALSELVGEALALWRERCPDREFRRRIAKSLPAVHADPVMLRRAVDELLDNAVKFSPGGEPVSISAALEPGADGTAMVRLSVRDRGVGIEPDTAARVFADFYQVDASETRHYGGLGLGLALVRRIVEGMGGVAEVASEVGSGSVVHLVLPACPRQSA